MLGYDRITLNPNVMGGHACIGRMHIIATILIKENFIKDDMHLKFT